MSASENQHTQQLDVARRQLWRRLQQPRVMLVLLAAWAIVGAATEFFTSSGLFVDLHGRELDGALGGRAFGWEAVPLAALYIYALRNPERFRGVFWIAFIEQSAAIVSNLYHWGAGDFSFESVFIPVAVAAGLTVLVFLHLFGDRHEEGQPSRAEVDVPQAPEAGAPSG